MKAAKTLSLFTLAMINVAAIGSVKNWPLVAEYGFSAIFFYILAALVFFIPISLVSAELATGWPHLGGIFVWVKEAFGHRTAFLTIWLLWIENIIWYPTVLSFIAATLSYIFDPQLASNPQYMVSVILVIFWGFTFANLLGMRVSGWISSASVILGTFIPAALIIGLGAFWFYSGKPRQITFSWDTLIPNMASKDQWIIFTGVLLTLAGMEMSSIHAKEVKNPQRDYPKAIWLSAALILGLSLLGVLAISIVIPKAQISLVAGSLQAFSIFVSSYGLSFLIPIVALLIAIGAMGSLSTWIIGPSKGLLAAAEAGDLPPYFRKVNAKGMPVNLLITQAVIVTFLSLLFLIVPTINTAYWMLSILVTQLYLIMYIIMFAAGIKLRYKRPEVVRAYKIPCKNFGMWTVGVIGIVGALFSFYMGFFPPAQITEANRLFYFLFLAVGIVVVCGAPSLILRKKWKKS